MAKSERNKTIETTVAEGGRYLDRCISKEQFKASVSCGIQGVSDKTVLGDSLEIMKLMPAESVDLIIADPPYNLDKGFAESNRFSRMDDSEYEEYTRNWLSLAKPLLKKTGTIYVCCDWQSSLIIGRVLDELFTVRNRITWQREKGRGASANWKNGMEDIWFATVSQDYTFNLDDVKIRRRVVAPYRVDGSPKDWDETSDGNFRDTCPSNFWDDVTIPFWSMKENTAHPTQKSEKLVAKMILASSNEGDLVFDPFLGSGTTSVTAAKLGRKYLGVEQDERFCIWAEQRLEMAQNDRRIQGYDNGVFWERNVKP